LNKTNIEKMIDNIDWCIYETVYGNAGKEIQFYIGTDIIQSMPVSLLELFSKDKNVILKATHNIWCCLCHQHSYVSSAALPAYDILMRALDILDDTLKFEILDILLGFAFCTSNNDLLVNGWRKDLRNKLIADIDIFGRLSKSACADISEIAIEILNEL